MQLTDGLRRSKLFAGDRLATIYGDRRVSWRDLAERVSRLAAGFRSVGVRAGDRIAILSLNSDLYIEAYYAIAWAGCVSVGLNTRWAQAELDYAVEDSRPAVLVFGSEFQAQASPFAAQGIRLVAMQTGLKDVPTIQDLIAANAPEEDCCGSGDELAAIFYTGGTTGRARGVMLSHDNLAINFLGFHAAEPYEPETIFLHIPPMFHCGDASCIFALTMLSGTHVVLPGFDTEAVISAIQEHKVTALFLVPTMIGMLAEAVRGRPADLSSVRRLTYGASSISEATLEKAMELFPNARFCQGYGQTELSPNATVLNHADHLKGKLRSAGRAIPYVGIRIVDTELNDLPTGVVGEVLVSGPGIMLGYLNKPEATRETIVGGWLHTGDAGYLDSEGYLFLVDRVKDMIVSGGENIYSAEVENALLQHSSVIQCAVIGVPDTKWGEAVHAVLYVREGSRVTEEQLREHCAPRIARYKQPKSFDIRYESLPLSGVGKVLKATLREPFWRGLSRSIA